MSFGRHESEAGQPPRGKVSLGPQSLRSPGLGCLRLFLLAFIVGALVLIGITAMEWRTHIAAQAGASTYVEASGCGGTPVFAPHPDGCTWKGATVVATDTRADTGGEDISYRYFLTLRLDNGRTFTEEIPSEGMWSKADQGHQVTAEMWRSHVTQIVVGRTRFPTRSSPVYRRDHPSMVLLVGLSFFTLAYGSLVGIMMVRVWRHGTLDWS